MNHSSFSDAEFASKKKLTRRDRFLAEIEAAAPWPALIAALLPYYLKGDGRGRPPLGLERMLRMYIPAMLRPVGRRHRRCDLRQPGNPRLCWGDLTHESAPDATTMSKFRLLLENNNLARRIFD